MTGFEPQSYGPLFAPLVDTNRRRPLDAGTPDRSARSALEGLSLEPAFAQAPIADRDSAACCLSAAWLVHDYLDESHTISQGIETPSGSFWHGIMHRREGDFSNAMYWFRRVGRHPALDAIGRRAAEMVAARGDARLEEKLFLSGIWDPVAFVGQCESAVREGGASLELCLDIQQAEWELLFDHCYRSAVIS